MANRVPAALNIDHNLIDTAQSTMFAELGRRIDTDPLTPEQAPALVAQLMGMLPPEVG
jgi:hypothetical protein